MKWDYENDAEPWETYSEYIARKKTEANTDKMISSVVFMVFIYMKLLAVYAIFFYSGYVLSLKILGEGTDKYKIIGLTIVLAYLLLSVIFFLKGVIIGLKYRENKFWILLWLVCVFISCIFPAILVKFLVESFIHPQDREITKNLVISWSISVFYGLYVYNIFKFLTPTAPRLFISSYLRGRKLIN